MKTLSRLLGSSTLVALLTLLFTVGAGSEANAQSAPLTVSNMTNCPIYVQGQTAKGLTPGCTTAWTVVPPGTTITIAACANSSYHWYHVYYGNCSMPGTNCPMGTTNSPVSACGLPITNIADCTGSNMYNTVWTSNSAVTFY